MATPNTPGMLVLELPADLQHALTERAACRGVTPEVAAMDLLQEQLMPAHAEPTCQKDEGSLADFLKDHIGVIDSTELVPGGARLSERSGSDFGKGLVQKRQQGKL